MGQSPGNERAGSKGRSRGSRGDAVLTLATPALASLAWRLAPSPSPPATSTRPLSSVSRSRWPLARNAPLPSPPFAASPQRHRSLRSLGKPPWRAPANVPWSFARRRCPSPSLHFAPRGPSSCGALRVAQPGPQRPSPPAARPGLRPSRQIPGSAAPSFASGSTSALRSIPVVRPPPTARPSGSPGPSSTNQYQRGETPPPGSAPGKPGARLPSPTCPAPTSPAPLATAAQPARRKFAWPGLMRRRAAILAAPNAAGNSEQLVPKAHSHPTATVTRRATQSAAVATEPNPHART